MKGVKLQSIILEEKEIYGCIKELLNECKTTSVEVNNARYHHNSSYFVAPSIVERGILPLNELNKKGLANISDEVLELMDDPSSHANGSEGVSLSVVGLEDLSEKEIEYDPFSKEQVDFIVSDEVKAFRSSVNYGNEFIAFGGIEPEKLKSIDIRLIKYIESFVDSHKHVGLEDLIERYRCIKEVAMSLKENNMDIPLREMSSEDGVALDIDKVIDAPILLLKQ